MIKNSVRTSVTLFIKDVVSAWSFRDAFEESACIGVLLRSQPSDDFHVLTYAAYNGDMNDILLEVSPTKSM